jgi:hypothetical protein
MLENTERAIKNEKSRETDNIGYSCFICLFVSSFVCLFVCLCCIFWVHYILQTCKIKGRQQRL